MTREEKIKYMRIAMNLSGLQIDDKTTDLVVSLYELVKDKQGTTDIEDIMEVESQVKERAKEAEINKIKNS